MPKEPVFPSAKARSARGLKIPVSVVRFRPWAPQQAAQVARGTATGSGAKIDAADVARDRRGGRGAQRRALQERAAAREHARTLERGTSKT